MDVLSVVTGLERWREKEEDVASCLRGWVNAIREKQVLRMAPSEVGDTGHEDGFGGATEESLWDIRVSSSRTDSPVTPLILACL